MGLEVVATAYGAQDKEPEYHQSAKLPDFYGKEVRVSKTRLASGGDIELDDDYYDIDQILEVTVEVRVTGINHAVNDKTGELERVHRFKVIDIGRIKPLAFPE